MLLDVLLGMLVFLVEFQVVGYWLVLVLVFKNVLMVFKYLQLEDVFEGVVDFVSVVYGKLVFDIYLVVVEMLDFVFVQVVGVEDVQVGVVVINVVGELLIGIGLVSDFKEVVVCFDCIDQVSLVKLKEWLS